MMTLIFKVYYLITALFGRFLYVTEKINHLPNYLLLSKPQSQNELKLNIKMI